MAETTNALAPDMEAKKPVGLRRHFNKSLFGACALIATSTFNYGFDNQGYATTQAMGPFRRQFGRYSEERETWILPTAWLSIFNAIVYLGFFVGMSIPSEAHLGLEEATL